MRVAFFSDGTAQHLGLGRSREFFVLGAGWTSEDDLKVRDRVSQGDPDRPGAYFTVERILEPITIPVRPPPKVGEPWWERL